MIVAVVTNSGKSVSNHIALAKKIAFYDFPKGNLIKIIPNPIMEKIKDNNIKLEKNPSGGRHLKTGKELPKFLAKEGANIFIAKQMGEGMKMNLIDLGIKPCLTQAQTIEDAIGELKCL